MVDAHLLFTDLMWKVARCPTRESFNHVFVDEKMLIVGFRRAELKELSVRMSMVFEPRPSTLGPCLSASLPCLPVRH